MALVGDGVLAVTEGVPQLDRAVTGTRDDLSVVGGEGDGQDVVGVADEAAGGGAGGKLPEAESLVPRGGKGVGAIRRDNLYSLLHQPKVGQQPLDGAEFSRGPGGVEETYAVGDDVGVALEGALGVAVLGLVTGEVPDDQSLVTTGGQEHVGAGDKS